MIKEFEAKTEKEAIEKAMAELQLDQGEFDVEFIGEEKPRGLFRRGSVKIRVHVKEEYIQREEGILKPEESEKKIVQFTQNMIKKMGFDCEVCLVFRDENKIGIQINSQDTGVIIGKKGKNLDAIQLLVNIYAGRAADNLRVIIDAEDYRKRREDSLTRLARRMAEQARKSKGSRLLEPMNPFERRLIHTALNDMEDIDTKSEGEGLYKQVRIIYRGNPY